MGIGRDSIHKTKLTGGRMPIHKKKDHSKKQGLLQTLNYLISQE